MAYDDNNIFAKILRGEIPNKTVYEDAHVLAFEDINPMAPVHVLVIPKGKYTDFSDFAHRATAEEMVALNRACAKVAEMTGVAETGYRLLSNRGPDANQEVPHLHLHVVGGTNLKRMLPPDLV